MMRPRHNKRARRRAFTLIELLVVVAIIALLIGLVVPGLAGARSAARATKCLSNQRQIGIALQMYAERFKEFIPRESGTDEEIGPDGQIIRRPAWPFALRPFLDDRASWDKPEGAIADRFEDAEYYRDPARLKDAHNVHYVNNGLEFVSPGVLNLFRGRAPKPSTPTYRSPFPHKVLYLSCFNDDPKGDQSESWYREDNLTADVAIYYDALRLWHIIDSELENPIARQRLAPGRHRDGANGLFLDGHAEFVKDDVLTLIESWDDGDYISARDD